MYNKFVLQSFEEETPLFDSYYTYMILYSQWIGSKYTPKLASTNFAGTTPDNMLFKVICKVIQSLKSKLFLEKMI